MSPLNCSRPSAVKTVLPFSVRLAQRRLTARCRTLRRRPPHAPIGARTRGATERSRMAPSVRLIGRHRLRGQPDRSLRRGRARRSGCAAAAPASHPDARASRRRARRRGAARSAALVHRESAGRYRDVPRRVAFVHPIDLPSARPVATAAADSRSSAPAPRCRPARATRTTAAACRLARPALLKVLESSTRCGGTSGGGAVGATYARAAGRDPSRAAARRAREDAAAALEMPLPDAAAKRAQTDVREAARTLETLIGRCFRRRAGAGGCHATRRRLEAAPASTLPRRRARSTRRCRRSWSGYADGDLLKGFTHDFHPSRAQFALWPSVNAAPSERVVVPMSRLKAVFFVRDFEGNPDLPRAEDLHDSRPGPPHRSHLRGY